jgi:dipeptidyl aminopeptidase/acylaminoacyl peptidase
MFIIRYIPKQLQESFFGKPDARILHLMKAGQYSEINIACLLQMQKSGCRGSQNRFLKLFRYIFLFFFFSPLFSLTTSSLYFLHQGEEIADITQRLLRSSLVEPNVKKTIIETQRRFFLFNYPSGDIKVRGYITFTPNPEGNPLLILLRGGMNLSGLMVPASDFSTYSNYTVIATAYRGSLFQGIDECGGADVDDVKTLIDFIPQLEEWLGIAFNPSKSYVIGGSRGAMQMFLALARYPELQERIDKIVSVSGLLDAPNWFNNANPSFLKYRREDNNPLDVVPLIRKDLPILIVQGTEDRVVDLDQGRVMYRLLKENDYLVDYFEKEGGNHCLSNDKGTRMERIAHWLEQ